MKLVDCSKKKELTRARLKARVYDAGGHYKKTNVFLFLGKYCLKLESLLNLKDSKRNEQGEGSKQSNDTKNIQLVDIIRCCQKLGLVMGIGGKSQL